MAENFDLENGPTDDICELADAVVSGRATEAQRQRLDELVSTSEEACWTYVRYMHDTVFIHRQAHETRLAASLEQCQREAALCEPLSRADELNESSALLKVLSNLADEGLPYVLEGHLISRARTPEKVARPRLARMSRAVALGLAVAAVGSIAGWWIKSSTIYRWPSAVNSAPQRVARIIRSVKPVWVQDGKDAALTTGDWLMTGRHSLTSGFVQIMFPWGTKVSLEAPVDIEFTPEGERRLWRGQLVATVSPEDTGFTINTPSVKLVDLGTEFGLSTEPDGRSEIHVFKGAVEARPQLADQGADAGSITMLTGDANSFTNKELPVQRIAFNPKRFSRAWRLSSQVSETTGAMRFVHPAPNNVGEGKTESNEDLILFLEREKVHLSEAVTVTLTEPGLYTNFTDKISWLPAGVEADSYLVHFDPVGSRNDQPPVTAEGSVTFDRPILGVIARGDQLAASDQWFAAPSTQYQTQPVFRHKPNAGYDLSNTLPAYAIRGLTGLWNWHYLHESPAPNDWLRLSADRKTLTARLAAGGEANQFRIIVAVDDQERPAVVERPLARSPQPYHGKPFAAGQTIEAEDFDHGGQDVAYYDTTPDSLSNVYRPNESVELRSYVIGDQTDINVSVARAGEWLTYTVDIDKPGSYVVKASAGSKLKGGMFRFEFGETATSPPVATKSLAVPITKLEDGDRSEWYGTAVSSPVELAAGRQIMRVVMEANHTSGRLGNFDSFRIEPVASSPRPERAAEK